MRRRLAVLAAVPLIFAAACGTDTSGEPAQSGAPATAGAATGGVKVTGAAGAKPSVVFPSGAPAAKSSYELVTEGSGDLAKAGEKLLVNLTVYNWDGKTNAVQGSTYDTKKPESVEVGPQMPKVMQEGMAKVKPGGRLVTVIAADSYTKEQIDQAKAQQQDLTVPKVFVFDVIGKPPTPLKAAEGADTGESIKDVKLTNPGGEKAPELSVKTEAKPSKELVVKTIIKGIGKPVTAGQTIVAHYTGKIWGSDKKFDSSWDRGQPAEFPLDGVIPGWTKGLTGVTIGSRVLLSIPSADGYGAQGNEQAGIKGTDTLVFVVDVLSAY